MKTHKIAPSLLAANFLDLGSAINLVNASTADWFHLDIMDGRFVPNISYGMFIVEQIHSRATKPLDVHLMIEEPERYIGAFRNAGAEVITVHYEACRHLHRTVHQIKETGAQAGVALNPHTPVHVLEDILEDLDLVLIMSVNPGFGGQKFIYQTLPKLEKLRDMLIARNLEHIHVEVDGGVGLQNAHKLLEAGANVLVAGSTVFGADDPTKAIADLKAAGPQLLDF